MLEEMTLTTYRTARRSRLGANQQPARRTDEDDTEATDDGRCLPGDTASGDLSLVVGGEAHQCKKINSE
jgi:hypothetical protein